MPTTIKVKDADNNTQTVNTADAIAALLGEVQASPTANTVLDRLKTLGSGVTIAGGPTTDGGPSWTTVKGVAGVPFTSADQHSGVASVSDAPTSGQKLVITDIFISVDTAMSVTFKCETTGAVVTGPYYLPANGTLQLTPRGKGWKLATADKKLQVVTSVAGNIMVDPSYYSEA